MSDVWTWLERELHPPGVRLQNRRALYRIIARIGQQVADDIARSKRQFFAGLAESLAEHGESSSIPRLHLEPRARYRRRLAAAADVLAETGEEQALRRFLDGYVPKRWRITDSPRDVFRVGEGRIGYDPIGTPPAVTVYITNLTQEEQHYIATFLEWFLGADVDFDVISGGYSRAASPLGLAALRHAGGSPWLAWHLGKVASVKVDLLPDDAFGIGRGKGMGSSRVYRGAGAYVAVRCATADRPHVKAALKLLIDSSIETIFEEVTA